MKYIVGIAVLAAMILAPSAAAQTGRSGGSTGQAAAHGVTANAGKNRPPRGCHKNGLSERKRKRCEEAGLLVSSSCDEYEVNGLDDGCDEEPPPCDGEIVYAAEGQEECEEAQAPESAPGAEQIPSRGGFCTSAGQFLDLVFGQDVDDPFYAELGLVPARYYEGIGISCDVLPGYERVEGVLADATGTLWPDGEGGDSAVYGYWRAK